MAADKNKMGSKHEEFLAELNGGRKTKSSGNQWNDRNDGQNHPLTDDFPFSWDGKSTLGQGINVTLDMIAKCREHAGLVPPMLGLRWYANESLSDVREDWIAIPAADWQEVLEAARTRQAELNNLQMTARAINAEAAEANDQNDKLKARIDNLAKQLHEYEGAPQVNEELRARLEQAQQEERDSSAEYERRIADLCVTAQQDIETIQTLERKLRDVEWVRDRRDEELAEALRVNEELRRSPGDSDNQVVPRAAPTPLVQAAGPPPGTGQGLIVLARTLPPGSADRMEFKAWRVRPGLPAEDVTVTSVRIQPDGAGVQQMFVNDQLVREGEYWHEGVLRHRAPQSGASPAPQQSEVSRETSR